MFFEEMDCIKKSIDFLEIRMANFGYNVIIILYKDINVI